MPIRTARSIGVRPYEQVVFFHLAYQRVNRAAQLHQPTPSAPYGTLDSRFAGLDWPASPGIDDYVAYSAWLDEHGVSNMVVAKNGLVAVNGAAL